MKIYGPTVAAALLLVAFTGCGKPDPNVAVPLTSGEAATIQIFERTFQPTTVPDEKGYDAYVGCTLENDSGLEVQTVTVTFQLRKDDQILYQTPVTFDTFAPQETDYVKSCLPGLRIFAFKTIHLPAVTGVNGYWMVMSSATGWREPTDLRDPGHWFTYMIRSTPAQIQEKLAADKDLAILIDPESGVSTIHIACTRTGAVSTLNALIADKASVRMPTKLGFEPIHYASRNPSAIDFLVQHGADVNVANEHGYTALSSAAFHASSLSVKKLVGYGAKVNVTSDDGRQPIQFAVASNDNDSVDTLLDHGADPNSMPPDETPLIDTATEADNPQMIASLVKHGANVNATMAPINKSALHFAAQYGYQDCIDELLKDGIDVNIKTEAGHTAADLADRFGFMDIASKLRLRERK